MTLDPGPLHSQSGVPLKKLSFRYQWSGRSTNRHNAYATDQTLGILIHRAIFGELKFILKYLQIHVGVVISPEGGLNGMVSK
jgi:hypothetical protein